MYAARSNEAHLKWFQWFVFNFLASFLVISVVVVVVVVVLGAVSSVPDSLRTAGVAERSAGRGVSW